MQTGLHNFLPFLEVNNHGIVSKSGDLTVGFEIGKQLLFSHSAEELQTLHQYNTKAIQIFEADTTLHFMDWYRSQKYTPTKTEEKEDLLTQASQKHFEGRPFREHRAYCFITLRATNRKNSYPLLQTHLTPEFLLDPNKLRDFEDRISRFQALMTDSKLVTLRRLTGEEMTGTKDKAGLIEQYCTLTEKYSPVLGDVILEPNLQIGDKPCCLFTLSDAEKLPPQCSSSIRYEPYSTDTTPYPIGFASGLGPFLDVDHIYNQVIIPADARTTLAKLETRKRRLQALTSHSPENGVAAADIARYQQEAAESQRIPVNLHLNILAWGDSPADVKDLVQKVSSAIARMDAVPHRETVNAAQIWAGCIPGNAGHFPIEETFHTFAEQAACFLIPGTNNPATTGLFKIVLGSRFTGIPILVDISDAPLLARQIGNRNKFVLGGSGSGKSFFINHLVRSYILQNAHVVIVDVGGSYRHLCMLYQAVYLTYEENNPLCFNPFLLEFGDQPDIEKKQTILTLLQLLWKKPGETITRYEDMALSNAVYSYYRHLKSNASVKPCFNTFYEFLKDHYPADLKKENIAKQHFDIENLLFVLRPYYKDGEYGYLLNAVDQPAFLHQPFIVFELDNIKDHPILFPVVTIIIMDTFITKMRKLKGIRKVILLEEAWKALAKEGMSEFIKYLFLTVRKFFGEAIVVTQNIEDILSSPIVKNTIINNADCKILLDQSKFLHRFQQIQDLLGLTEKDRIMISSLNKANDPTQKYKEVFIGLASGPSNIYRVEVSLEEYLLYTTEEREKKK